MLILGGVLQQFVVYRMADPGTIQLVKSGITFVTAITIYFTVGTKIQKMQWVAIIIQVCCTPLL